MEHITSFSVLARETFEKEMWEYIAKMSNLEHLQVRPMGYEMDYHHLETLKSLPSKLKSVSLTNATPGLANALKKLGVHPTKLVIE